MFSAKTFISALIVLNSFLSAATAKDEVGIPDSCLKPRSIQIESIRPICDRLNGGNRSKDRRKKLKYPYRSERLYYSSEVSSSPRKVRLYSDDGDSLTVKITTPGDRLTGEEILITPDRIIGWQTAKTSEVNSNNAISAAVTGALVFPPLILVAPFLANQQVDRDNYLITYVREDGIIEKMILSQFLHPAARTYRHNDFIGLISDVSGLKSGEVRKTEKMRQLRLAALDRLVQKIQEVKGSITSTVRAKPWCSKLDRSLSPDAAKAYDSLLVQAIVLNDELGANIDVDPKMADGWDNYLSLNPAVRRWAEANPALIEKYKKCPN